MIPKSSLSDVDPEELLNTSCSCIKSLPFASTRNDLQLLPRWELLLEFLVHLLGQLGELLRVVVHEPQGVLGEAVEDVQAVNLVTLGNGQVKANNGQRVWFWNAKRGI